MVRPNPVVKIPLTSGQDGHRIHRIVCPPIFWDNLWNSAEAPVEIPEPPPAPAAPAAPASPKTPKTVQPPIHKAISQLTCSWICLGDSVNLLAEYVFFGSGNMRQSHSVWSPTDFDSRLSQLSVESQVASDLADMDETKYDVRCSETGPPVPMWRFPEIGLPSNHPLLMWV